MKTLAEVLDEINKFVDFPTVDREQAVKLWVETASEEDKIVLATHCRFIALERHSQAMKHWGLPV